MTLKAKLGLVVGAFTLIVACLYASAELQLRHETLVRVQAEQQLLMSLSLMVEPFLVQNKVEQVKGHLLATSFSSTLPVKAILVYQADGNLFAATQFPRELFNFSPTRDLTGQKALQDGSNLLWSAVMVTPASMSYFDTNKVAAEGSTLGYVAIQISPLRLSQLWWWQSSLWGTALFIILALALLWQRRIFKTQHLRWQGFLRQLRSLVPSVADGKKLSDFDGTELTLLFRSLYAQQQQFQQHLRQQDQAGEQQGQTHNAACEQLEISYQQQLTRLNNELKNSQAQLRQWQQLCVLEQAGHTEQQTQLLNWLLKGDLLDKTPLQPQSIWFPEWLAQQMELWQQKFKWDDLLFIVVEDPALSLAEVEFCPLHTAQLLKQILSLILQDLQQHELSLFINLQAFSENKLLLQFDHAGQSSAIQQVLDAEKGENAGVLQQLCAGLLSRLGARLSVSALEDLGCSVRLELPLTAVSVKELPMYQTAIYLDSNSLSAAVLKQSVGSVAEQVICLQQPQQLNAELQHRLVDVVLLQLPAPDGNTEVWSELNKITDCSQMLAFCHTTHQSYWAAVLKCPVLSNPMLSANIRQHLSQVPKKASVRLLVVDDNQTNLNFVKAMLSQQQFEVDTAASGTEAIRLAKSSRYQLILMDIQLPDMSGILATHMIRQLPQHQHTVIMAFTAHALPEEIQEFHQAGMNDVVIKPLDAQKVADLIRRCQQLSPQTLVPG
ncbi:MAG: response regulator [Gammaproteobacteria bacterium]|nr:response regulator [Gammaproteobacteria bacterium]MBU2059632.1 response regulator [Gammaproteobacteria bacterium]MBU2176067.1 response regulator [Gammaproteobacteria bacterium]MBU2245255.1 response regulator [Gammaproteobacteria bacterium]MBU2343841.1 response regulator [Gammaproteobacteria bacterium]